MYKKEEIIMIWVRDLMSIYIVYCILLDNVYEVVVKMKEELIGLIFVVENE